MNFGLRFAYISLLTAAYFLLGKLGLSLAYYHPSATPVWPPTGLSLAALIIGGYGLAPGIFLGALLVNASTTWEPFSSITIAFGNTLEALVGAYLINTLAGGRRVFDSVSNVFRFFLLGGMVATAVSATIGVASLCLVQLTEWEHFSDVWMTWWLGDFGGAIIFTPFLLACYNGASIRWNREKIAEAVLLAFALFFVFDIAFGGQVFFPKHILTLDFVAIPLVMWTAVRFGQRETSGIVIIFSIFAISNTLIGRGPFVMQSLNESLLVLQTFLAVLSLTGAALSAIVLERSRLEESLRERAMLLSETDRRKDEFLAMLAHELRNPLSAISNAVQLVQRSGKIDPSKVHTIIERQVKHLARLIDDLLDVSRFTRGKIRLHKEDIVLNPILECAIEEVQPLLQERRHSLVRDLVPAPVILHADPTRIQQAVVNLLTNAAKYTDPGGNITLRSRICESDIEISVKDSGVGIAPGQLSSIFEPFTQIDRSVESSRGGLGVGLSLVRTIAFHHGGTAHAHSDGINRGSEFLLRLPLLTGAAHLKPSPQAKLEPRPDLQMKILTVDDHRDTLWALSNFLHESGFEVITAEDGLKALELAKMHSPDLVLLDLGLPGMNGYELARQIRIDNNLCGTRLVAISGFGQQDDRNRSKDAGIDHHLLKPVDYEDLLTLIHRLAAAENSKPPRQPQAPR